MKIKVWITKYALTSGILEKDATPCGGNGDMVQVGQQYFHREGRDWHRTLVSAQKKAEVMRVKKIASYRKIIEKLEKLQFAAGEGSTKEN